MSKRILFLTPQLPYPPHQGTTLRNFGLIRGLAAKGHQIGLLSFIEDGQPVIEQTPLINLCQPALTVTVPPRGIKDRIWDMLRGKADMTGRLWSDDFRDQLRNMLKEHQFDVIHIEGIEMAPYLPELNNQGAMLVYDAHNAEYALQRRIFQQDLTNPARWHVAVYSMIQWLRLTRFETLTCGGVDQVMAVSEMDCQSLTRLKHRTPVTVVPNAILIDQYNVTDHTAADIPHPALVFTGKMDYRPNVDAVLWFVEEILPLVQQANPGVTFVVVGKNPHPRLDPLRERQGVLLTGFVPEIQPYLRAADVYVAPLRMGSGTRFKLLEAMAMQRAIVSTRIGAEGISVEDGVDIQLADNPLEFSAAVIDLLRNDDRRRKMGQIAHQRVQEQYDWSAIIPIVETLYS